MSCVAGFGVPIGGLIRSMPARRESLFPYWEISPRGRLRVVAIPQRWGDALVSAPPSDLKILNQSFVTFSAMV